MPQARFERYIDNGGERKATYARSVDGLNNFEAYLARLGLGRTPSFFELHREHVVSIGWDNIDAYSGIPVSLEPSTIEDKLVARRRGGYCFEHNLLFMSALRSIGIEEVVSVLARVRRGDPTVLRPFGHVALRVRTDGRDWLADVGLAQGGLLDPIPMEPGLEHDQSGWRFRLIEDGREPCSQRNCPVGSRRLQSCRPTTFPISSLDNSATPASIRVQTNVW